MQTLRSTGHIIAARHSSSIQPQTQTTLLTLDIWGIGDSKRAVHSRPRPAKVCYWFQLVLEWGLRGEWKCELLRWRCLSKSFFQCSFCQILPVQARWSGRLRGLPAAQLMISAKVNLRAVCWREKIPERQKSTALGVCLSKLPCDHQGACPQTHA